MTTAQWSVLHALYKHGKLQKMVVEDKVKEEGCGDIRTKDPFTDLKKAGLVTVTFNGFYSITDKGRDALHGLFLQVFPLVIRLSQDLQDLDEPRTGAVAAERSPERCVR
ncbi:MAG: hypothetical protein OXC12_06965 [Spirochaetaceae bacterium]|nr:hypothetical protein [Spirochaetaceae bacterium]